MGKTKDHRPHSSAAPLGGSSFGGATISSISPGPDPDHDGDVDQPGVPDNDNNR